MMLSQLYGGVLVMVMHVSRGNPHQLTASTTTASSSNADLQRGSGLPVQHHNKSERAR